MLKKGYKVFIVVVIIVLAFVLGFLSGFVVGYNDILAEHVAYYRVVKKNSDKVSINVREIVKKMREKGARNEYKDR